MITQEHWSVPNYHKPEEKGFWLTGKNYEDCLKQLQKYGKEHPEKWIYFYNCGMRPGKPIPLPEQLLEVCLYDECPVHLMFMYTLFQEGCEGKYAKATPEDLQKQMVTMAMLGNIFLNKK